MESSNRRDFLQGALKKRAIATPERRVFDFKPSTATKLTSPTKDPPSVIMSNRSAASAPEILHLQPEQNTESSRQQDLQSPKVSQKKVSQKLRLYLMPSMALLLFVAGAFITVQTFTTNKKVEAEVKNASSVVSENPNDEDADSPSEVVPTSDQVVAYKPQDPMSPRYLRINKIDLFARTYALGIDKSGKLRSPNNIYNVGWYDKSAKPGSSGAVLLDGHLSGKVGKAVFRNLKKLKPGDTIEIERGDGQKYNYKVVKTESYPVDKFDMAKSIVPIQPDANGLNIITCSGRLDSSKEHFDERLLVQAVQV